MKVTYAGVGLKAMKPNNMNKSLNDSLLTQPASQLETQVTMTIKIRYFASLKESLEKSEDEISGSENAPLTAKKVWQIANPKKQLPENILVAINMDYATLDDLVQDGDEVAFFPPVTGG